MKRSVAIFVALAACSDPPAPETEYQAISGDLDASAAGGAVGGGGIGPPSVGSPPRVDAGPDGDPGGTSGDGGEHTDNDAALSGGNADAGVGAGGSAPGHDASLPRADGEIEPPPPDTPAGDAPGNVGFIGASCGDDDDCDFEAAFCLGADEGFPNGTCSQDCDRLCPDRDGASVTFCVGGLVEGGGACVQQCDYAAFPTGCRPGYGCRMTDRFNDPDASRQVCLPGAADPPADNPCADELNRRRLDYIAAENPMDRPDGAPNVVCDVEGALMLRSPVGGVNYRYVDAAEARPMFMACALAIQLDELSAYMRELDVVELVHIGTYNCRVIAGSDSLSMHGLGLAIDIHELRTSDGTTYNTEDDWEPGDNPQTPKGRFLYEFGMQMFMRGVFNIVLTPNYNAAHYNHFHVDLTPGGDFIGRDDEPSRGVFPNQTGD